MNVLIVKTSSMGDILHTLPALTDAGHYIKDIKFDWVVEEGFSEIPYWHPLINEVIPVAIRRWRKQPLKAILGGEVKRFCKQLRAKQYDVVLDAQGLLKTSWITRLSRGVRAGLDKRSAWEPLARLVYQKKYSVAPRQHSVTRMRKLFCQALDYPMPETEMDYGLDVSRFESYSISSDYVVLLHGTTWETKHWPESYWLELAQKVNANGLTAVLAWGNEHEKQRASRIADQCKQAELLPKLKLSQVAALLAKAKGVVGLDSGLGHLATALRVPTILLYGPTDPKLIGTYGDKQLHLDKPFPCAPCWQENCHYKGSTDVKPACFSKLDAKTVWQQLDTIIK